MFKIKKVISLVISLLFVFSCVNTTLGSQDVGNSHKTKEELVQELLNDGLNNNDAVYYAEVSKMFDKWKDEGKILDFSKVKEDLSNEFINSHPNEFRARILSGDLAAIKKATFSQAKENGQKDVQDYFKKNPKALSIIISYPDGSKITAVAHTTKAVDKNDKGIQTNSNMPGPWDSSYNGGSDFAQLFAPGSYTTTFTETTYSGTNYLKVRAMIDWTLTGYDLSTYRVTTSNKNGVATSVGLAEISSQGAVNNYNDTDLYNYDQAYYYANMVTKVGYTVGEGFSMTFYVNQNYSQYAIIEITYAGGLNFFWGFAT